MAGWTQEAAYKFICDSLHKEASRFLEEKPPSYVVATQGRGRFIRRFEISLEPFGDGILLQGRITSPEDWPVHVRRAVFRLAAAVVTLALGLALMAVSVRYDLDDWPILVGLLLFSVGFAAVIVSWGLYTNARLLNSGREIAYWLG